MKSVERIKEKKKIEINTQVIPKKKGLSFFSNVEIVNHKFYEDKERKNKNLTKELVHILRKLKQNLLIQNGKMIFYWVNKH